MTPECLYWLALAVLVLPSLPFNKVAIAIAGVWVFGHFSHLCGPYEHVAYMVARIVALGAALGLSQPWDGSRRSFARMMAALLFLPSAGLSFYASVAFHPEPQTVAEYEAQTIVYWVTWATIMLQAVIIPFGNDWEAVRATLKRVDDWMMGQIIKRFGDAL